MGRNRCAEAICFRSFIHIRFQVIAGLLPCLQAAIQDLDILNACPEISVCHTAYTRNILTIQDDLSILGNAVGKHIRLNFFRRKKIIGLLFRSFCILHFRISHEDCPRDMSFLIRLAVIQHACICDLCNHGVLIARLVSVNDAFHPLRRNIHGPLLHRFYVCGIV